MAGIANRKGIGAINALISRLLPSPTGYTPDTASFPLEVLIQHLKGISDEFDAGIPVVAHAATHKNGGSDEVSTAIPAADEIIKANAGGTLANGWVAVSNVTQHIASIDHDGLLGFVLGEHRLLNDAGVSSTELWSSSKINGEIAAAIPGNRGHIIGSRLSFATVATATLGTTGQPSSVRDSTDDLDIDWSGLLTGDITVSGAGGLDTGSEASSTYYFVYAIADSTASNTPTVLFSTSSTSPTMPAGYNRFRRVGFLRNDSSSDFLDFGQHGNGNDRVYVWRESETVLSVLTNGAATTFTNIVLDTLMPPTSTRVYLQANHESSTNGDFAAFRRDGSTEASPPNRVYGGASGGTVANSSGQFWMETSTSQIIEYENSAAVEETDVWVLGVMDEV